MSIRLMGRWLPAALVAAAPSVFAAGNAAAPAPADAVYRHGYVYTADAKNTVAEALAVRDGRIAFVGTDEGVRALVGPQTQIVDLGGRMLMPGLIDGHMHPLEGGAAALKCSLNYERLTVAQTRERLQKCLDATRDAEPDGWLEVVSWFQEGALPAGTVFTYADLDALVTKRPIVLTSSFGHTMLVNRRALELAGITASTPDPVGGRIARDASGQATGLLEDGAFEYVSKLLPAPTPVQDVAAARAALDLMRRQGVTGFLDAMATPQALAAFEVVQKSGGLTARGHFAPVIPPPDADDPKAAVGAVVKLASRFDQGALTPAPGMTVRNAKLFIDGVITAPAMTGALIRPYFHNVGTAQAPNWVEGDSNGPAVYFAPAKLKAIVLELAAHGLDPHMHADGDLAVRTALDAYQALRTRYPGSKIRAAIAHDEIVDPADFGRYARLDVIPVLSMQWEKPAADTVDGAKDYLGPARYPYIEPAGYLRRAGARIAFGSDWPVDALDEWFALKVGVTRQAMPETADRYPGRLGSDPGLSVTEVLRAATINAAYELHQERQTGSLEAGKCADFIVLDRNLFRIAPQEIAGTQVLRTVVGGKTVYQAGTTGVH